MVSYLLLYLFVGLSSFAWALPPRIVQESLVCASALDVQRVARHLFTWQDVFVFANVSSPDKRPTYHLRPSLHIPTITYHVPTQVLTLDWLEDQTSVQLDIAYADSRVRLTINGASFLDAASVADGAGGQANVFLVHLLGSSSYLKYVEGHRFPTLAECRLQCPDPSILRSYMKQDGLLSLATSFSPCIPSSSLPIDARGNADAYWVCALQQHLNTSVFWSTNASSAIVAPAFGTCQERSHMHNDAQCLLGCSTPCVLDDTEQWVCQAPQNTCACNIANFPTQGIRNTSIFACDCCQGYDKGPDPLNQSCTDTNECLLSGACATHAICTNTPGSYLCECDPGYDGDGFNVCELTCTCPGQNQVCVNGNASNCVCAHGFAGDPCIDIDECLNVSACATLAICTNTPGSYTCACPPGFAGNALVACNDINECLNATACAANRSTCVNAPGSYNCTCNAGYTGNGHVCTDVNECTLGTHACATNTSLCTNTNGSFTCTCNAGFSGPGTACSDVDECVLNTHHCSTRANCTNTAGSYTCTCNAGYTGNGTTCVDINECTLGTHTCPAILSTCVNTNGSFNCACGTGFLLVNSSCTDTNECLTATHNCFANASCTNTNGSFTCACNVGYTGSGTSCTDINECTTLHPCQPNATCTNSQGSFACACNTGFSGDGISSCVDINECSTNVHNCANSTATCTNTQGSFTCACNAGFGGNGVSCVSTTCTCTGPHVAFCANNTCYCISGYQWPNGSLLTQDCIDINECNTTGSCPSNGTCTNTPGSFSCSCPTGYTLPNCSNVDECTLGTHNCLSTNAHCTDTSGSFICACNSHYVGNGITSCQDTCNLTCSQGFSCVYNGTNGTYPDACVCNSTAGRGLNASGACVPYCAACNGTVASCNNSATNCACPPNYIDSHTGRCDLDACSNTSSAQYLYCVARNASCLNANGSFTCTCDDPTQAFQNETCVCRHAGCTFAHSVCALGGCTCETNWALNASTNASCEFVCPCNATTSHCADNNGNTTCICKSGFSGQPCVDIDECATPNFCVNNTSVATCTNTFGNATCTCNSPGFAFAVNASNAPLGCFDIDECAINASRCGPHVGNVCNNTIGSYTCTCGSIWQYFDNVSCVDAPCPFGFVRPAEGRDCVADCCANHTCCPNATCPSLDALCIPVINGSNYCTPTCGLACNGTDPPCPAFMQCVPSAFNITNLSTTLTDLVTLDICECVPGATVVGNGLCEPVLANECQQATDDCNLYANTQCTDQELLWTCDCLDGYIRVENSQECIADCCMPSPCLQNEACHPETSVPGICLAGCGIPCSYTSTEDVCTPRGMFCSNETLLCECPAGTLLTHWGSCIERCVLNATCSLPPCQPGYERWDAVDVRCHDIDECARFLDSCHPTLAICNNTEGGYTCTCIEAYQGNGTECICPNNTFAFNQSVPGHCYDVDECANNYDNCAFFGRTPCINLNGNFTCTCPSNLQYDQGNGGCECAPGSIWEDGVCRAFANVCESTNLELCGNPAFCNATTALCNCPTGYTMVTTVASHGTVIVTCADIDECAVPGVFCYTNVSCTNFNGSYACNYSTCTNGSLPWMRPLTNGTYECVAACPADTFAIDSLSVCIPFNQTQRICNNSAQIFDIRVGRCVSYAVGMDHPVDVALSNTLFSLFDDGIRAASCPTGTVLQQGSPPVPRCIVPTCNLTLADQGFLFDIRSGTWANVSAAPLTNLFFPACSWAPTLNSSILALFGSLQEAFPGTYICADGNGFVPFNGCDICEQGRYSQVSFSSFYGGIHTDYSCQPCAQGKISTALGSSSCTACPSGSFASEAETTCSTCASCSSVGGPGKLWTQLYNYMSLDPHPFVMSNPFPPPNLTNPSRVSNWWSRPDFLVDPWDGAPIYQYNRYEVVNKSRLYKCGNISLDSMGIADSPVLRIEVQYLVGGTYRFRLQALGRVDYYNATCSFFGVTPLNATHGQTLSNENALAYLYTRASLTFLSSPLMNDTSQLLWIKDSDTQQTINLSRAEYENVINHTLFPTYADFVASRLSCVNHTRFDLSFLAISEQESQLVSYDKITSPNSNQFAFIDGVSYQLNASSNQLQFTVVDFCTNRQGCESGYDPDLMCSLQELPACSLNTHVCAPGQERQTPESPCTWINECGICDGVANCSTSCAQTETCYDTLEGYLCCPTGWFVNRTQRACMNPSIQCVSGIHNIMNDVCCQQELASDLSNTCDNNRYCYQNCSSCRPGTVLYNMPGHENTTLFPPSCVPIPCELPLPGENVTVLSNFSLCIYTNISSGSVTRTTCSWLTERSDTVNCTSANASRANCVMDAMTRTWQCCPGIAETWNAQTRDCEQVCLTGTAFRAFGPEPTSTIACINLTSGVPSCPIGSLRVASGAVPSAITSYSHVCVPLCSTGKYDTCLKHERVESCVDLGTTRLSCCPDGFYYNTTTTRCEHDCGVLLPPFSLLSTDNLHHVCSVLDSSGSVDVTSQVTMSAYVNECDINPLYSSLFT